MTDITIPREALEKAARAACEYYTSKEWSDVNQGSKGVWRSAARAACIAMLRAWPGMREARNGSSASLNPHIILPLTESDNAKG